MFYKYTITRKNLIILGVTFSIISIFILIQCILKLNPNMEPVAEPRSGEILSGTEAYYQSEITVTASSSTSCIVKLKTQSGVERLSFYVRAGDTVTVGVPCERLQVYFASGYTWYGNEHLFGAYTDYSKSDEVIDFSEYTYKVTLYHVSNGNFSPTPINKDEFIY